MDRSILDNAMETWINYRGVHPISLMLPLLTATQERNRIEMLYNKIKMNQWTCEELPEEVYDDFISSVFRWRDMVTLEVLRNGSV